MRWQHILAPHTDSYAAKRQSIGRSYESLRLNTGSTRRTHCIVGLASDTSCTYLKVGVDLARVFETAAYVDELDIRYVAGKLALVDHLTTHGRHGRVHDEGRVRPGRLERVRRVPVFRYRHEVCVVGVSTAFQLWQNAECRLEL